MIPVLIALGLGAIAGAVFARARYAKAWRDSRHCAVCGDAIFGTGRERTGRERTAQSAGAVTAFASGSYAGARAARDVHMLGSGRVGVRLLNKGIGRALVSKLWVR